METAERNAWIAKLSCWQDPAQFGRLVSECHEALGQFGAMIEHGTGFWRDAWLAQQQSIHLKACSVRLLHPEPYPDFALMLGTDELRFETTEAIGRLRRRGDEYREDLRLVEQGILPVRQDPADAWLSPEMAFELLQQRASAKACKPYAGACGLLIYLNESEYGSNEQAIRDTFLGATEPAGLTFRTVDVLWHSQVHRVWDSGKPAAG